MRTEANCGERSSLPPPAIPLAKSEGNRPAWRRSLRHGCPLARSHLITAARKLKAQHRAQGSRAVAPLTGVARANDSPSHQRPPPLLGGVDGGGGLWCLFATFSDRHQNPLKKSVDNSHRLISGQQVAREHPRSAAALELPCHGLAGVEDVTEVQDTDL